MHVVSTFKKLDKAKARVWDFLRPTVVFGGKRMPFRAIRGRVLAGVATAGKSSVLLIADGERLAAVHLAGKTRRTLHIASPGRFAEVDVDALLALRRTPTVDRPKQARAVSPALRTHHDRIAGDIVVDAGDGPSVAEIVRHGFEDLAARAAEPHSRAKGQRVHGKTRVRYFVEHLHKLVMKGCRDLQGRPGDIIRQIKSHFPNFDIDPKSLGDVFKLLRATGTPIVVQLSAYIWHIKLVGLNDPDSDHHRQFCANTTGLCRIPETREAGASSRPSKTIDGPREPTRPDSAAPTGGDGSTTAASSLGGDATTAQLLLLVAGQLAVARAREEAVKKVSALQAAWAAERAGFEARLTELEAERVRLKARAEHAEAETTAVRAAADTERVELLARVEQAEAAARAARAAVDAARVESLSRVVRTGADARTTIVVVPPGQGPGEPSAETTATSD